VQPITKNEIKKTFSLAKGKLAGADEFPAEFFQQYWEMVKGEVCQAVYAFYRNELDLWRVNQATIILAAKKQGARQLDHY
jgi:hypothetical protein